MNKSKKVALTLLIIIALILAFLLGVKFTLNNQKIVTLGGRSAKSSVLMYEKEYFVNRHHIHWGIVID